jgi:hypothetical protein
MSARGKKIRLAWVCVGLALWTLGCVITYPEYGQTYFDKPDPGPGLLHHHALLDGLENSEKVRAEFVGNRRLAHRYARCEIFRAQLMVASERAAQHLWMVWGFPFAWPGHVLTLWIWPVGETQKARAVIGATERVERAYQTSDGAFLAACEKELGSEVGQGFLESMPAIYREPVAAP